MVQKKITAVVPYLAYARQDKVFLQGEAISIEAVAHMLKVAGIDSLITVNVHQAKVLAKFPRQNEVALDKTSSGLGMGVL